MAEMTTVRIRPDEYVGLTYLEAFIKLNRTFGYPVKTSGAELIDILMEDLKVDKNYGKCINTLDEAKDWLTHGIFEILNGAKDYM